MTTKQHLTRALLATSVLCGFAATPAFAQSDDSAAAGSDIIVTARRSQERLQDVPISISVLQSEDISKNNIVSAGDIAAYTPNLSVNRRFGDEGSSFIIRGFQQENGTAATVGVYFADVVALRGGGEASNGGDGAGPGSLYDLENIQVLKGPQGTLFGRNSTGGAVLLVPTKPKRDFGGYVEGSAGDYGMYRVQGAVNIPVGDTFRLRIAGDHMSRDGYLRNLGFPGRTGRQDFADVNYYSFRVSAVADLSPDVENYTIATFTHSDNNGVIPAVKVCQPGVAIAGLPLGNGSCQQIARESAANTGFWTVANSTPATGVESKTWQVINTTTWQINDALELKNIFSYGELKSLNALDYFGNYIPVVPISQVRGPQDVLSFINNSVAQPYGWNNKQSTMVEELRLSGHALNQKLDWQAGLYYELSEPLGTSGQQYGQLAPCADVDTLTCRPFTLGVSAGSLAYNVYRSRFRGIAGYAQGSYHLTDQFTLTAGIRYTDDEVTKEFSRNSFAATGAPAVPNGANLVWTTQKVNSHAPTWLLGIDYKPTTDVLVYAKYARGYRQGNVNASANPGLRTYGPEKVDSYEGGLKAEWRGSIPGRFSVAGFYNNFRDQQLQVRLDCTTNANCPVAVATVNVGKSRLYGFEADLGVTPFKGLDLSASYGYLNTKILSVTAINLGVGEYDRATGIPAGANLPYSPKNSFTGNAKYTLPLPTEWGELSLGGTIIYAGGYLTGYTTIRATPSPVTGFTDYNKMPSYTYGNVNVSWDNIGGMPIDASVFVTNVTNKKMVVASNEQYDRGFVSYYLAPPRMWGARIKYRFGN